MIKTKIQNILKKSIYWFATIIIGIILGFSLQFVKAWTEPSATAPNGNVSAPINISATSQYKSGALGIGGLLRGYSDVMGNRLCIGADCRSTWPATGLTNGVSAGYPYTSINNDNGNGWPEYSDSTYGGSNFSNWPDYSDSAGSATNATYGRYVYNNGAYAGSGWMEASSLGVYYAYLGRYVYNNGAYSGSGWIEPSDLGVRYASSAGYSSSTYGGSNFSAWPNYAYSAGNSDTVDGYHASSFASRGLTVYQCPNSPCYTGECWGSNCYGQLTTNISSCYSNSTTYNCSPVGYVAN